MFNRESKALKYFFGFESNLPFSRLASLAASSLANCFFSLSLKYLSALSYKTGYFLSASESRCSPCWFFLFFVCMFSCCFMKTYLAHIASRVHITKIMKQVWSKTNFEAWSEARYQNFLIFLFHCLLHTLLLLHLLHACSHCAYVCVCVCFCFCFCFCVCFMFGK